MVKMLLILCLSVSVYAQIKLNFSEIRPKVTRDKEAYRKKLREKHGSFIVYSDMEKYLGKLCDPDHRAEYADFEPEKMFSFVVEQNGRVLAALNRENGKKVKHLDLGDKLIGGGEIKCL